MPQFICESCGACLYSAARSGNLIDPSCPSCGASFEAHPEVERSHDGTGLEPIPVAVPAGRTP